MHDAQPKLDARQLLESYLAAGKVMQVATLEPDGSPAVCNVWFASATEPDRLWFISRPTRFHSANLRKDGRVAGAILAIELTGIGQPVRGVTFTGVARELPTVGIEPAIGAYVSRWPSTARAIDPARLASGEAHHRVYEIAVTGWVLFDEENFPTDPRQVVAAR